MTKAKLIKENKHLHVELNNAKMLLEQKNFIISKLQKMLFGPKSERYTSEERQTIQISLFAELEAIRLQEQQAKEEAEQSATIRVSYARKKKTKKQVPNRIPLPDHLPRVEVLSLIHI